MEYLDPSVPCTSYLSSSCNSLPLEYIWFLFCDKYQWWWRWPCCKYHPSIWGKHRKGELISVDAIGWDGQHLRLRQNWVETADYIVVFTYGNIFGDSARKSSLEHKTLDGPHNRPSKCHRQSADNGIRQHNSHRWSTKLPPGTQPSIINDYDATYWWFHKGR